MVEMPQAPTGSRYIEVHSGSGVTHIRILLSAAIGPLGRVVSWLWLLSPFMLPAVVFSLVARAACWVVGKPVPPFGVFDNPDMEFVIDAEYVILRFARGERRWSRDAISDIRVEDVDCGEDTESLVCLVVGGELVPVRTPHLSSDAKHHLRDVLRASLGFPAMPMLALA